MSKNSDIISSSNSFSENSSSSQIAPSNEERKKKILERQTKRNQLGYDKKKELDQALVSAAKNGDIKTVKFLLGEGADIEAKDHYLGMTALIQAADNGNTETVKLLLKEGANIEAKDTSSIFSFTAFSIFTALIAAARGGYTETVKLLLEKGANIEAKGRLGTALIMAARLGHTEIVKLLLEKGANIEAKKGSGATALIEAAEKGYAETVKLLLEKGADIEAKDTLFHHTALIAAARYGGARSVNLIITSTASSDQHQISNELGETTWDRIQNQIRDPSVLDSLDQEMIIFLAIILPEDNNLKIALASIIAALKPEDQTKIAELTALRATNLEYFAKQNKDQASSVALANKRTYQILKINSNQPLEDWEQDKIILKLRDLRQSLIKKVSASNDQLHQELIEKGQESKESLEIDTAKADKMIVALLTHENLKEISSLFAFKKGDLQFAAVRKSENNLAKNEEDKELVVSSYPADQILEYFKNADLMALEVIKEFFKEQNQAAVEKAREKGGEQKQEDVDVINEIEDTTKSKTEEAAKIEIKDPNPNSKISSASRMDNSAAGKNQVSGGCCVVS